MIKDNDLPAISYDDLIHGIEDADSDLDLYLQYMIEIPVPGATIPELEPNPALVTGIPARTEGGLMMGAANRWMRNRRHGAYRRRIREGWTGIRIVTEGDSWFQYPTKLQDVIDHLIKDHAILSLGAAGDRLSDIQAQREILLNIQAEQASALLLSAGGNDLFENGQLGDLIEKPFPGASAQDLVGPTLDGFLAGMADRYLALFRRVHSAFPHVHILIHGYGPAFPKGGRWIAQPLGRMGVSADIQHDVVREILARFNTMLATVTGQDEFDGQIAHIDVTGIGTAPSDWYDEIHLDGPNAAKVAERFRAELKRRFDTARVETGVRPVRHDAAASTVMSHARMLSAFDEQTLLRELDLRVSLLEMDPSVADEADLVPLVIGRPEPEIGIASIRRATRRLIDRWMTDLREVVCSGADPDNPLEETILDSIDKSRSALSGAIAGWLVTGPLAVPAVLASALAAWLAGELLELGRDAMCGGWKGGAPGAPPVLHGATEGMVQTVGDVREMFRAPSGDLDLGKDRIAGTLARLDEALARKVVEPPTVPVDAQGAAAFRLQAQQILRRLGDDTATVAVDAGSIAMAEALILVDGTRPALYVRDGFVDLEDTLLTESGWLDDVKAREEDIRALIGSTGRIIRGSDRSASEVYGTAWMLEGGRVATARHVVEVMADDVGGDWILRTNFFVDFAVEADGTVDRNKVFKVEAVEWTGPDLINGTVNPGHLDAAILTLAPKEELEFPAPVPLAAGSAKDLVGNRERFFNVGHPGQPFGSWLVDREDGSDKTVSKAVLFALIGGKFGVKRFSPGVIEIEPGKFAGDRKTARVFTHNATTLGGSSGSPIVAVDTKGLRATGLHFAGMFGMRNYAHSVPAIRKHLTKPPKKDGEGPATG